MTPFGFLTGTILELLDKNRYGSNTRLVTSPTGARRSIIRDMITLFSLFLVTLTESLIIIEIKDIYWLQHNPERLLDGSGRISIIKEFIYVSVVLFGYAAAIIFFWTRLLKQIFNSQELALEKVSNGPISTWVPVFEHDELGKLTEEEFEIMKGHPQIGADALAIAEQQLGSSSFLKVAQEISLTHHEKWDGSGYPRQLSGKNIPISGRLMALADVYDALISKRVYKPAFSQDKAREIILEGSGGHFDPLVVEAFLSVESAFIEIASQFLDKNH